MLNVIKDGYKIQFNCSPLTSKLVVSSPKDPIKIAALESEINKHILSGAISKVSPSNDQFVSRVFVVEKKTGGFRLVIDLKRINQFINKSISELRIKPI